jgi:hypothetical protein
MESQTKASNSYILNVRYLLFLKLYYLDNYNTIIDVANTINSYGSVLDDTLIKKHIETHLVYAETDHNQLQLSFNLLLETKELLKYNLAAEADTLFYTCLHLATICFPEGNYWTVNNNVIPSNKNAPYSASASLATSISNTRELATLCKYYLQSSKPHDKVTKLFIDIDGKPIEISQPSLRDWIVQCTIENIRNDNYPLVLLGEHTFLLSEVLKKQNQGLAEGHTNMIDDLNELGQLPDHEYTSQHYKMITQFCEQIHKMFSTVMNEDPESYNNKQLILYCYILKLFNVVDFTTVALPASKIANRLRTVITRKRK